MLEELMRRTVRVLEDEGVRFALVGGMVTSFYRKEIRTTQDVDFAILIEGREGEEKAKEILRKIDLEGKGVTLGALKGVPRFVAKKTPIAIVGAKVEKEGIEYGVDILLPALPWVNNAVKRAENNIFDFGFAKIPGLTVEDVIIAKLYAYLSRSDRFKDLDDLQNIFIKGHDYDWNYISLALVDYQLFFPEIFDQYLPVKVARISRKQKKKGRAF